VGIDNFVSAFDAFVVLSPGAWALLNKKGTFIRGNVAFADLQQSGGMFRLDDQVLHTNRLEEDDALHLTLRGLSPDNPRGLICLRSRVGRPAVVLDMLLVPEPNLVVARAVNLTTTPRRSARRLWRIFGFTPAEVRIAEALEAGLSIEDITQSNGTRVETVRGQVKAIRSKAGTRSQSQLVGMLIRSQSGVE